MEGKIVIAVDFGTTYSAIGYAHVKDGVDPSEVDLEVIDRGWPGQGNRRSPKIPSIFKSGPDGFKYGFQVQDDPDRVCFAKLFLDPDQIKRAQHLARFTTASDAHPAPAVADGVTQYLRCLRERSLEHMVHEKQWGKALRDRTKIEYTLSVPAMWSDKARDQTLQCAFDAGYGIKGDQSSIRLVSEPEAAAIYTITTLPNCAIHVNDIFVVCDAGGGTVDFATYRITALEPALHVEEAALGAGDLCGSVLLNRRFREFVERKIGTIDSEYMQDIEEEFNCIIKPSFNGDDTIHTLEVGPDAPDKPSEGLENGRLAVTSDDLKGVFDPVIDRILVILADQISAACTVEGGNKIPILLVGGFGSSEYLKIRISEAFEQCRVLQPPDAWSAVVRGALKRSMIKKRKIRGAYGVLHTKKWSFEHEGGSFAAFVRPEYKIRDRFEGDWRCSNHMEWYVKKGDEFSNTKVVSFPFYSNVGLYHSFRFEINLWAYLEGHEGHDPPPFKDIDCLKIAVLKPDLSKLPKESFPKRWSPTGEPYYKVDYFLEMSFDTIISFKLRHNGILYGDVETEYLNPMNDGGYRTL